MATYRDRFNELMRQAEEAQGVVDQARQDMSAIVKETQGVVGQARQDMSAIVKETQGVVGQARQDMSAIVKETQGAVGQARQDMSAIVKETQGAVGQARQDMSAITEEARAKVEDAVSESRNRMSQIIDEALVSRLGAAYDVARRRNQSAAKWGYVAGIVALVLSVGGAIFITSSLGSADQWLLVITRLGISVPTAAFAFYAFSVASKHRTKALQDEQYASELTTLLALFDSLEPRQAQAQLGSLKETLLENYFPGAKREMELSRKPEGFQVNGKFLATAAGAAVAVILTLSALLAVILAR